MAHSPTYEVRVRREIRDALAIDPIATIPELTERLNKRLSHSFDPRYIKKLTDKVAHQLIIESDRLRIEDRMKVTRENHRIVREELQFKFWAAQSGLTVANATGRDRPLRRAAIGDANAAP